MDIIGHRGACGYVTENTMASFARAESSGCQIIELDVHVCRSGELVVYHDFNISEGNQDFGRIQDLTIDEINKVPLMGGYKIPILPEVLEMFLTSMTINIELKGSGTAKPVQRLLNAYEFSMSQKKKPLISSLQTKELIDFYNLSQTFSLGWVIEEITDQTLVQAKELHLYSIHPSKEIVNKEFVYQCHQEGYKVYVFTVNEFHDYLRLKEMGVDAIFTDFPDKFLKQE